ncbi:MAG: flagellar hook-length control protein FliK [Pseudomonadota bacterium]|nr:flagellar hook-length control protein FliK [Pseudomonadota bacterium]
MDIRADIEGVRAVARLDAALPVARIGEAREEMSARLALLAIGTRLQGTVQAQLADGSFVVKLPDAAIRTNLPTGNKVGDALQLTLVATAPRPTFSIDTEAGAAPTTLSPTARLIDTLLQRTGATTLIGKTAVVDNPAATPAQLASSLQKTLSESGLFYESHLQQWNAGERPLAALLREPQNQTAAQVPGGTVNESDSALSAVTAALAAAAPTTADPNQPIAAMHADTAQLVNLQLNTLDQPRIQWQGEVWPGQRMEWEVSDESSHRASPTDPAERSWQSVVRFDLPTLGRIAATITLTGGHVQVQVRAADAHSAQTLRQHGGSLASALEAADSALDQLTIRQDAQA